ncbi:MAG: hypothetical protein PHU23_04920 [Dehalococcoidales bacterium]|nr:hypothetical protein [Dehalococcoidales bacterium]
MEGQENIIEGEAVVKDAGTTAPPPAKVRDELKINIIIKGDHILIGAQASDCDPRMTTLSGNLQTALERIPSFVEESNRQWDVSERNPKTTTPEPTPPTPVRTATTSASKKVDKTPQQPSFF